LLARLQANKSELFKVLDRPEIPLHTNGSENDIRCHVTRRKVSGGTRSDRGRDARDTFLVLAKTCTKLGISFWNYLGARLNVRGAAVPPLPSLIPTTSRCSSCRPMRRSSIRRKIFGMKFARKSSGTTPSNRSTPCTESLRRRSSTSSAIQSW
jgi:hypothetical protein